MKDNIKNLNSYRTEEEPEISVPRFLEYAAKMVDFEWRHHKSRAASEATRHTLSSLEKLQAVPRFTIATDAAPVSEPFPGDRTSRTEKGSKNKN